MEQDKPVVNESSGSGFLKDPVKVAMALVIVVLLVYIVIISGSNQQPTGGGNQTANNTTSNVSVAQPAVNVKLVIVNDNGCILCDPTNVVGSLEGIVSNLTVTNVSYSGVEGRAFMQEFNATWVPLYVFDSSIEQDPSFSNLSRYLRKSGSRYMLTAQPVEFLNRTEQNDTVELFVMSHGGYGVNAEKNMKEVLDALPGLKFVGVGFVGTDLGNGSFSSPNGPSEVDEDLRQVCVMKYYPEKIIGYTTCIAADYNNSASIWQNCSSTNSIDVAKIQNCSGGDEGKGLLSGNLAVSESLGIYASPTVFLNNNTIVYGSYASSAELLKEVVCANDPMSGCNKTLSGGVVNKSIGG